MNLIETQKKKDMSKEKFKLYQNEQLEQIRSEPGTDRGRGAQISASQNRSAGVRGPLTLTLSPHSHRGTYE